MEKQSLYLIKQFVRIASLICATALAVGLGLSNLSMVPDLFNDPNATGWGNLIWPIWIVVWLVVVGCTLSARATWQQITAARRVQNNHEKLDSTL